MSILVNHAEIRDEEIGQEMQYHPAASQKEAWRMAARSLVIRQLLLQKAADCGLTPEAGATTSSEEEHLIDRLLQQNVSVPKADEATCRRFYEKHPDSFIDRESGQQIPFDDVRVHIRDYLHTKAVRVAVAEYIKALSYDADIKGFDLVN